MAEENAMSDPKGVFTGQFDWGSWKSWRAMLASSVLIGVLCGFSALGSNAVVHEFFGMNFGDGPARAADFVALLVALGFVVSGVAVWIGILKHKQFTGEDGRWPGHIGDVWSLPDVILFSIWYVAALAVFLGVYLGIIALLAIEATGSFAGLVAVIGIFSCFFSLSPSLDRLGAKRLPSRPIGR